MLDSCIHWQHHRLHRMQQPPALHTHQLLMQPSTAGGAHGQSKQAQDANQAATETRGMTLKEAKAKGRDNPQARSLIDLESGVHSVVANVVQSQLKGCSLGEAVFFVCEKHELSEREQGPRALFPCGPMFVTVLPKAPLKQAGKEQPKQQLEEQPKEQSSEGGSQEQAAAQGEAAEQQQQQQQLQPVRMRVQAMQVVLMTDQVLKGFDSGEPGRPAMFISWWVGPWFAAALLVGGRELHGIQGAGCCFWVYSSAPWSRKDECLAARPPSPRIPGIPEKTALDC